MKTIGIIGGLSPESTAIYYKRLNEEVRKRTGGAHAARIVIVSVDGGEIWRLRQLGDWDSQGAIVADAAKALQRAGADFIVLAGNTMHRCAEAIEAATSLPFLHLADATARRIRAAGLSTIGLTGTSYTMIGDFYTGRLAAHGITSIVPDAADIAEMDRVIYRELVWGNVTSPSKVRYQTILNGLVERGAKGLILGCTELTSFMPMDCGVPLFDTTEIHIEDALETALAD